MSKKLLALVLSAAMLLGLVGCLEEKPAAEANKADAQPAATQSAATDSAADELPAFTLGDFTVTVGEVRSSYNTVIEYMGYYGVSAPTTAEEIGQYRDMVIEDLLSAKVLPWKAKQMGVTLTEEKRAEVAQQVEELLVEYAADYLDQAKEELGEDEDEEIIYTGDHETELVVGSANEVLEAGFVIDEDSPEDIMDVFGDAEDDTDTYED